MIERSEEWWMKMSEREGESPVGAGAPDPAAALIEIVEGIKGAMEHGTWRDDHGRRLKDTPEWVAFYVAVRRSMPTPENAQGAPHD